MTLMTSVALAALIWANEYLPIWIKILLSIGLGFELLFSGDIYDYDDDSKESK